MSTPTPVELREALNRHLKPFGVTCSPEILHACANVLTGYLLEAELTIEELRTELETVRGGATMGVAQ